MIKEQRQYRHKEMFALYNLWQESGLTQHKFCQEQGIKPSVFNYWIKKFRDPHEASPGFVQMELAPGNAMGIEVLYPNGIVVRLPGTDVGLIRQLVGF